MKTNLTFKSVTYANFLATGNKSVTVQLDASPTTLIYGKNGSGKSTMYEALFFGLYGRAFRKSNKPDLINNINNKKLLVTVEFSISGNNFKVIRGMKPNIFEIYCNDKMLDQGSKSLNYQAHLEKNILKMSAQTFVQTVILGSLHYVPYMRLPVKSRREIIEELLDIQIFSTMNIITKTRIASMFREMDLVDNKNKLLENSIQLISSHIAELETNREKLKEQTQENITSQRLEKAGVESQIDEIAGVISDSPATPALTAKKNKDIYSKYEVLARRDISDLEKAKVFFTENDACDRCHQEISGDFKDRELVRINTRLIKVMDKLESTILPGIKNSMLELQQASILNDKLIKLNTEIVGLNSQVRTIQNNIDRLEDSLVKHVEITDVSAKKNELNNFKAQMKRLTVKRIGIRTELEEYDFIIKLLKDDGIKKNIIKIFIPIINRLISKYLSILGFPIKFTFDEEFKETIIVKGRRGLTYSSFSAGEKMRVDLALLFSFRELPIIRTGNSCNLLIFDEVADSAMDIEGWDSFLSIIDSISDVGNVFVISPRGDILVEKFTKSFMFKKSGAFSMLENME